MKFSCSPRLKVDINHSKIGLLLLLLLFGLKLSAQNSAVANRPVFYVALVGNDNAEGSYLHPVKSLVKAIELSRSIRENYPPNTLVQIKLRAGTYRISQTIQLDERDNYLSISAYENELVVLSGSIPIAKEALHRANEIFQVNLKNLGVMDYGKIRSVGFGRPYGVAWGELFVNKAAYHLARYPNTASIAIEKVIDKGSIPRNADYSNRGGAFKYKENRINAWQAEQDPWIAGYFMWGYADDMLPIDTISIAEKTIKTKGATLYGFGDKEKYRRWYGLNLKSELDTAYEYYVDHLRGELFFIPGEPVQTIEFSMLETAFFNVFRTLKLSIIGIVFEQSRGIGITTAETENLLIEGCVFQNLGGLGISMGMGVPAYQNFKAHAEIVAQPAIVGSLQQHLYDNTVFDRNSGSNNLIKSCLFRYLGAGGVSMAGGDRVALTSGNNSIENCVFHDNNRIEKSYRPAIDIGGVGNRIENCEIFNTPSMAILMHGNNHIIAYNYLHDVVQEVHDQGAIYYGRDPSESGNVVRYNIIENIPDNFLTAAIYHDDGACGLTAYSNLFINAGQRNVLIGGGSDNKYYNNFFIGRKHAVFIDNRLATWLKGLTPRDTGLFAKRLAAVYYQDSIYASQYPGLQNYFDQVPAPSNNLFHRNVLYNFKVPVFAKKKSMSWRKMALGFSNENVIKQDRHILKRLYTEGISALLVKHADILDPIPVHEIGLKNSIFIKTKISNLGIQHVYDASP